MAQSETENIFASFYQKKYVLSNIFPKQSLYTPVSFTWIAITEMKCIACLHNSTWIQLQAYAELQIDNTKFAKNCLIFLHLLVDNIPEDVLENRNP